MDRKLKFQFEFVDGGPRSLDYETTDGDKASISIEDGVPVLYVNRSACRVLAQIFAKLAMGSHVDGFHLHLEENLDPDRGEMFRIILNDLCG